jgi:hypothetical protein
MKSFILTIVSLMCIIPAVAQVWVKEDSFIYSKGIDIFVKGAINLESRSNIYLRKEAQLLQADNTNNVGIGELSIFQEGAANNFTYNFWSAPVSQTTGSGNQGFRNTQIKYPTLQEGFKLDGFSSINSFEALSTDLVSSFNDSFILDNSFRDGTTDIQTISGTTITQTQQLRIASRWLYKYNNASSNGGSGGTGYGSWQPFETAARIVEPGYGFTMKGVTTTSGPNLFAQGSGGLFGQRYDFRGRPNNGTIALQVIADDFALIGNPYPSALDLKKFLIDNTTIVSGTLADTSEIDAQVLFWESIATSHQLTDYIGGYGSYVPGSRTDFTDNGMYVASAFSRYDSNGNPTSGGTAGGNLGIALPIGINATRRYAPVGQGFVITRTSTADAGVFAIASLGQPELHNSQRVLFRENGTSSFFQRAPGSVSTIPVQIDTSYARPKIYFSATINDLYVRNFILAFGNDSTDALDWGLEAVVDNNIQINDMYMAQEGKRLIIKTIPFVITKKVAVSFVLLNPSTFEISVESIQHFNTPLILLHDTQNGTVYDLKNSIATVNLPAGTYDNRFEIVFEQPTNLSAGSDVLTTAIAVFQNNNKQLLTVQNPELKDIRNIAVYDLAGRLIISEKTNTARDNYSFNTANYSNGIYVVRITDGAYSETAIKVSIAN